MATQRIKNYVQMEQIAKTYGFSMVEVEDYVPETGLAADPRVIVRRQKGDYFETLMIMCAGFYGDGTTEKAFYINRCVFESYSLLEAVRKYLPDETDLFTFNAKVVIELPEDVD